jgi:hypothetical protein
MSDPRYSNPDPPRPVEPISTRLDRDRWSSWALPAIVAAVVLGGILIYSISGDPSRTTTMGAEPTTSGQGTRTPAPDMTPRTQPQPPR